MGETLSLDMEAGAHSRTFLRWNKVGRGLTVFQVVGGLLDHDNRLTTCFDAFSKCTAGCKTSLRMVTFVGIIDELE